MLYQSVTIDVLLRKKVDGLTFNPLLHWLAVELSAWIAMKLSGSFQIFASEKLPKVGFNWERDLEKLECGTKQ